MIFLFLVGVPVCLFPLAVVAQNCPNPVTIACGDTPSGSNQNGNDGHDNYGCAEFSWDLTAAEIYYRLTITEEEFLWINLEPTSVWDLALIVLSESGGDCGAVPVLCVDDMLDDDPEFTFVTLPAGTYYIVVDGYNDGYGTYDLTVICEECTDADGDTYPGLGVSTCFSGNDCCDTGAEVSSGCTVGNAADIHPGAQEICGDGIDNDCSGHDDPCPSCGADENIACADTKTVDTTGGASNLSDYCHGLGAHSGTDWSGPEHIFSFTPTSDAGVVFAIDSTAALDMFALPDYGDPAVCNMDTCLSIGGSGSGFALGNDPVVFYAETGETYFISVDGNEGAAGSFNYDVECRTEFCVSDADIACKHRVSGDTTGKDNNVSVYKGWGREFPAPEYVYALKTDLDADVVVNLDMETGIDLAIFVIEDSGDGCSPGDVLASSDIDNVRDNDWTEYVSFSSIGGVDYYVVVDGRPAVGYGAFDLDVTCSVECGEGFDDCGFGFCLDVSSDVDNCGACDNVCDLPGVDQHECLAGACTVVSCDVDYDDCDATDANGCEADLLADRAHCGVCNNGCGADQICAAGVCQDCGLGEIVCGNTCIDTDTDPDHCGVCDNVCDLPNVDQHGCVSGACTVVSCDADFDDCDSDVSNGCEVDLLTSDVHCGGCNQACDTAQGEDCCGGTCADLDSSTVHCGACNNACAAGKSCCDGTCADLNDDVGHCGACGNACATGESCCDGTCADLNDDDGHCGACGNACVAGPGCLNGTCCADADSDDHYDQGCGGDDCDDTVAAIHPGAEEICNKVDDDCNGTIDDGDVCKRDGGCGCMAIDGTPASGLFLLLLVIGLVRFRGSR
jgi:hypothetical protein